MNRTRIPLGISLALLMVASLSVSVGAQSESDAAAAEPLPATSRLTFNLPAAALTAADDTPGGDTATVTTIADINARTRDLTIDSPAVGTQRVRLILPANYDTQPDATWPVLYLLHGQGGNYTNWTAGTDVVKRLSENLDVLLVMPDAGAGYYSDWWGFGEEGWPGWETFHLSELPEILERDWRASDQRAVAGLSMGGFGAMSLAARRPGFFQAAASYSGVLNPLGSDFDYDPALWGDKVEQRDIWAAHDPVSLAAELDGIDLYVSYGDGRAEPGGPVVDELEASLARHSMAFADRLQELGIDATVEAGSGTHSWDTWEAAFERSLPMLLAAIEA